MSEEGGASTPDRAEATIATLRQTLLEIVREGEAERPNGVHLTHVGGQFAKRMGAPFESYLTFLALNRELILSPLDRKMVPFIEKYCADLFNIDRPGDGIVRLTVRNNDPQDGEDVSPPPGPTVAYGEHMPRYRKAAWLAFVRPLPAGLRRLLFLEDGGAAFTDLPEDAAEPDVQAGRYEIDRKFVVGIPQNQPIDGPSVHNAIQNWLAESRAPLDRMLETDAKGADRGPTVTDLIRVIGALSPDVAGRWLIPAAVLLQLRKP
jgi:hypothetical protein